MNPTITYPPQHPRSATGQTSCPSCPSCLSEINLLFLQRKDEIGDLMHHICYNYTDTTKNRLSDISATGLNSGTYQYDALGNLVRDNAEGLTIGWNALDKVDTIRRNGNILSMFRYSPTGQRQVKATGSDTTFYIHDATGNVMCVYRLKNDTLTASERYIYGSKRLGMLGQQVWITAGGAARLQDRNTIGHRLYELTDHLGNVTTTLPDRKYITPNADNEPIYIPDAVTYTDYYPFGFPMPRPGFTTGGYRYFFNGQEADNEVLGEGVNLTAEFWQYDSRLGRRWNVDPVFKEYESPYACFAGNPVWFADRFGADTIFDDDVARKDFLDTYQEIVDRISGVERKAADIRALAAQRNWKDEKLNRKIGELYEEKEYYTLLEMRQGFQEIMSDRSFCVTYSTDVSFLKKSQGGRTHYVDDKNVNVYYRPNMRGSLTHETRHVWGVMRKEWSNIGGYDTFDELWAFTWQGVIDAPAVDKLIETAIQKYNNGKPYWERQELDLKGAIDYLYTTGDLKHDSKIKVSPVPIPAP